jgi:hypothetical protein
MNPICCPVIPREVPVKELSELEAAEVHEEKWRNPVYVVTFAEYKRDRIESNNSGNGQKT